MHRKRGRWNIPNQRTSRRCRCELLLRLRGLQLQEVQVLRVRLLLLLRWRWYWRLPRTLLGVATTTARLLPAAAAAPAG